MYVKQLKTLKDLRGQVGEADKEGHLYKNYGEVSGGLNDDNAPGKSGEISMPKNIMRLCATGNKKYAHYHIKAFGDGCEVSV